MPKTYDISQLSELSAGSEEFILDVITAFVEHGPIHVKEIKDAFDREDYKGVGAAAHKLKPSFALINVMKLEKDIKLIEKYGKEETNIDKLDGLINNVVNYSQKVFDEIKKDYKL